MVAYFRLKFLRNGAIETEKGLYIQISTLQ